MNRTRPGIRQVLNGIVGNRDRHDLLGEHTDDLLRRGARPRRRHLNAIRRGATNGIVRGSHETTCELHTVDVRIVGGG